MTIALGLMATDGIVLAADTEISWTDGRKSEGAKIRFDADTGVAIAGAGDQDYINALTDDLILVMRATPGIDDDMRTAIENALLDFYQTHVKPQSDAAELMPELLIGLCRGGRSTLWRSARTTVRRTEYGAIGAGAGE